MAAECPRDAVLYELTGWDACMTWRLPSGRVLLQNFVVARELLTRSPIDIDLLD